MARYKMSGGLAMTPESDMKLLKDMSKKGWHMVGMKGIFYRFEEGEPCDFDYALNIETEINDDMLAFYEASGWSPVVIASGYQIFRAKAGTAPIFSDLDSREEVLLVNWKLSGKWASIFAIMLVIWFIATRIIDFGFFSVIVMAALMVCFIFTLFPFIGFSRSLIKLKK